MNRIVPLAVSFFCVVALGFQKKPVQPKEPALTPKQAAEARRTIAAWLECEECTDGELKAVVKLGKAAVPSLAASLHEGPSSANRERLRRHLATTYQELKQYEATHPEAKVAMDEKEYVKTYMDNYIALYQVRSATALGAIGGSDAKEALDKALKAPLRDDAKGAVREALGQLKKH